MFRKQEYIDSVPKEDMEQGLRELRVGDLLFDPWYGFGIILSISESQTRECKIKFYDSYEQEFALDDEQTYFLKRNIPKLIIVQTLSPKDTETKKHWNEMYCIF
jgi:hypothetical protein